MRQKINGNKYDGERIIDTRPVVHQAAGMISAQLEVTLATAIDRLVAYSTAHHRTIADVAADVVARRLRFNTTDT